MATNELNRATTTDFKNQVPNFIVESMALDIANADGSETFVYYDKATENFGYYFNHPQIASRINALCTWSYGQGYTVKNKKNIGILGPFQTDFTLSGEMLIKFTRTLFSFTMSIKESPFISFVAP